MAKKNVVIGMAALLLGIAIGGGGMFQFGVRYIAEQTIASESLEASLLVGALRKMRSGEMPAAIDLLEARIDTSILSIDSFGLDKHEAQAGTPYFRALRTVADYRSDYPRKSTLPEVDRAVSETLSRVSKAPN